MWWNRIIEWFTNNKEKNSFIQDFNKSAKDLSIAECAFLAGINHTPNTYNPYKENQPVPTEKITKRTKPFELLDDLLTAASK